MQKFRMLFTAPLLFALMLVFTGCENFPGEEPVTNSNPPHCSISDKSAVQFPSSGFPKMQITVVNDGSLATAYKVGCYVRLKKENQLVDEDNVLFGTLSTGESATEEAWFPDLASNSEYDKVETELYWYDINDKYYTSK